MKAKILLITLFFISLKFSGQDIRTEQDIQDINRIVSSYKERSYNNKGIKQDIVTFYNVHKILMLKDYADEIIKSFDENYFRGYDYYFLCFFDSIPDSIINVGVKSRHAPFIFNAKYGDSADAESLLSENYNYFFSTQEDEVFAEDKSIYERIIDLFLLKDRYPKAKEILCKILQSTKYTKENLYDARQDYKISISYIAIGYYLDFYLPADSISKINPLEFEVDDFKPINSADDINTEKFNQYKADFEKYFYQNEKIKIKINTPFSHLGEYRIEKRYKLD